MLPISSYAKDAKIRLLLQGPSGSGKTDLACGFPKPYFVDIDKNLYGVILRRQKGQQSLPVGYDLLDQASVGWLKQKSIAVPIPLNMKPEDIVPIPMPWRYSVLDARLIEAQQDPLVETIILDSATTLVDIMIAEVLRQQSKSEMTKREWGFFAILGKKLMASLSAMNKHVVLIIHETNKTDANGSIIYPLKVGWPGQVGDDMGKYFTNVWRCENSTVPKAGGVGTETKYTIRTSPNGMYALKNTLGLPATFEFDWKIVEAALKGGQ